MAKTNEFPEWLRDALGDRPNVYLVRNSGTKENGRPVIDDSRVSRWLKGDQRPSMELAVLSARVLGEPPSQALKAAGYSYGLSLERLEQIDLEFPLPADASVGGSNEAGLSQWLTRAESEMTDEEQEELWELVEPILERLKRDTLARRPRGSTLGDS